MTNKERAAAIIQDVLHNHLPRIGEALANDYVDENQALLIYDHLVRARILRENKDGDLLDQMQQQQVGVNYNVEACAWACDYESPMGATIREAIENGLNAVDPPEPPGV